MAVGSLHWTLKQTDLTYIIVKHDQVSSTYHLFALFRKLGLAFVSLYSRWDEFSYEDD
jgi:hypothetical protein